MQTYSGICAQLADGSLIHVELEDASMEEAAQGLPDAM